MNKKKLVAVVLVLLIALLLPAIVSAATTFRTTGKSAAAELSGYDSSGCIYTDVFVGFFDSISKDGGRPTSEAQAFISVIKNDLCTGETLIEGNGFTPLDPSDFTTDSQLQSAQLDTTIELFNLATSSTINLDVNLTWTGIGELSKDVTKVRNTFPGCKLTFKSSGISRQAQISGSISDGATNLISETEPLFAVLTESKYGSVTVGCGG